MTKPSSLFLSLIALAVGGSLKGQGCSDAGVCTAGPLGDIAVTSQGDLLAYDRRTNARVEFSYGAGEHGTVITQLIPELNIGLSHRAHLQFKIPYTTVSGDLGTNSGLGDLTITGTYALTVGVPRGLDGIIGVKINSNEASALASNTRSLPMPYQTSLGTKDLLLGLKYRNEQLTVALAYQHVLKNENNNGFQHLLWMDNADAQGYFESDQLERADDAVARIQYAIPFGSLVVQPGVLGIYHLSKDKRLETDQFGDHTVEVDRSEGLTLNITGDARYVLNDQWSLNAAFGAPVKFREARPDGLTRHFVLSAGLQYAF